MAVRIPREKTKRKMESTISLINIVFLMLIFFLVAGQLAPPADKEVDLVETPMRKACRRRTRSMPAPTAHWYSVASPPMRHPILLPIRCRRKVPKAS